MFTQEDSNISNKRNVRDHTANDIFPAQVFLILSIKCSIIRGIVVAFSQDLGLRAAMES